MSDYPGRPMPPKSDCKDAECAPAGRTIEQARKQCGRNGMPLLTDPVQHPQMYPLNSEAENEKAIV